PTYAFVPVMTGSGFNVAASAPSVSVPASALPVPARVEAIARGDDVVVAWEGVLGAAAYQVWRAAPQTTTVEGYSVPAGWGEAHVVAQTPDTAWVDAGAASANHLYYVTAVAPGGVASGPSNLATLGRVGVQELMQQLAALQWSEGGAHAWDQFRQAFEHGLASGEFGAARQAVSRLRQDVRQPGQTWLAAWQAEDATYVLYQLERRLALMQSGILHP